MDLGVRGLGFCVRVLFLRGGVVCVCVCAS